MHLGIIKIILLTTEQHNLDVRICATHFMDDRFLNLEEEVNLTLLWKSGASESVTVSMFFFIKVFAIDCSNAEFCASCVCVCVCVCVCTHACVCVWERETGLHHSGVSFLICGLCTANTYKHHHCVCHATLFPSWAWTDGKTKDFFNCRYIYFESWSLRLW